MLACKIPNASARSMWSGIRSAASATLRKRLTEASFKLWNSVSAVYWSWNLGNCSASARIVSGLNGCAPAGLRSISFSARKTCKGLLLEFTREKATMLSTTCSGVGPVVGPFGPIPHDLGIALAAHRFLPHVQIARNMRLAVRVELQPAHEKEQAGVRLEGVTYGAWRQVASAERFIEELQSSWLDEVGLLGSVDARKGVKIGGYPALILAEETGSRILPVHSGRLRSALST